MPESLREKETKPKPNIGFEEGWTQIKKEVIDPLEMYLLGRTQVDEEVKILFTAQEYSRIYTLIYNMCTQSPNNWSRHLFSKYCETIENFLRQNTMKRVKSLTGSKLLLEFRLAWSNHLIYTHWMERFFGYLNKYHIKITGEGSLMLKGITIFYETIYLELKESITLSFSNSVREYRHGAKNIDAELLKGIVDICLEMSEKSNIPEIYENEIEKIVIADLNSNYGNLAHKWARQERLLEYLNRVDNIINFENNLCEMCFNDSTWKKIKKSLSQILLADEMDIILSNSSSIKNMFVKNEFENLKLLFRLFSTINNGVYALSAELRGYLIECGQMVVSIFSKSASSADNKVSENEGNSEISVLLAHNLATCWPWTTGVPVATPFPSTSPELLFVQTIISLYDHSVYMLGTCFNNDVVIQKTIKESFEIIVNMEVNCRSQAKLVCCYCDALLRNSYSDDGRNSNAIISHDQFVILSEKLVEIFSYIHFQDYFLHVYKFQLAQRLLQYHLFLEKNEQYIICMLRNKCGSGFTSKLEGMISDIQMTQNLNKKFKEYLKDATKSEAGCKEFEIKNDTYIYDSSLQVVKTTHQPEKVDFTVSVLTCSNWPSLDSSNINLPNILENCIREFEMFYRMETNHRKLSWIHWYGQCVLEYKLPSSNGETKCLEIRCNTYQACILLLFSDTSRLSLTELQSQLDTDRLIVLRHMEPLYSDTNIVKIAKDVQAASDDLVFELNLQFAENINTETPIIVKLPHQTETTQKNDTECDKSHAIEAAIVRILKIKGEMTKQDVISHVISRLGEYKPSEVQITEKINYLIERDYLASQQDDPDKLIYVV